MAPEILRAGTKYKGTEVDLFAMGVILFIMVTGLPPFKIATSTDPYYQYIEQGKLDRFWGIWTSIMEARAPGMELDESFKRLITLMLLKDPDTRPCLTDILAHPWMQGHVAGEDELLAEM